MFNASYGWAYFKNVYILLPNSWAPYSGATPATDIHEDAQIRVELTHAVYGDSPFTLQTGECGDQGEYIQVKIKMINISNNQEIVYKSKQYENNSILTKITFYWDK